MWAPGRLLECAAAEYAALNEPTGPQPNLGTRMAWNEPGGEKRNPWNRPQQSQNDLDDVLRNLQRRLSALFGRGGGAGGGPGSPSFARGLGTVLVLIGAVWITSGMYRVDAQERAVVLRFGQYVGTMGPGYNWHLPWPIERKIIVNVSQQYSVPDDAQMLTADTNLVEVRPPFNTLSPIRASICSRSRGSKRPCGRSARARCARRWARHRSTSALAFDPSITDHARVTLQKTLDNYDMGVHIISVTLQEVVVPEPVQDAQRDAIKADKDRQRYQQDAETYHNDVVPRARGAAAKEMLDAEAYRAAGAGPRARRDLPIRSGPRPIRTCSGRDPRAHVYRDHGECLQEFPQSHRGYQERRQHAVSADRQVDPPRAAGGGIERYHDGAFGARA